MAKKIYVNGVETDEPKKVVKLHEKVDDLRDIGRLLSAVMNRSRKGQNVKVTEKEKEKLKK